MQSIDPPDKGEQIARINTDFHSTLGIGRKIELSHFQHKKLLLAGGKFLPSFWKDTHSPDQESKAKIFLQNVREITLFTFYFPTQLAHFLEVDFRK